MATLPEVWQSIRASYTTALDGYVLPANIFIDTPPPQVISNLTRSKIPFVHIFDSGKHSRNTYRWGKIPITPVEIEPTLVSTLSGDLLASGGSQTLTLSDTITVGDAVSLIVQNNLLTRSVSFVSETGATLTTIATGLAAAINANTDIQDWLTATAVGPVITIQSTSGLNLKLYSHTGNVGSQITEIGRTERLICMTLWTASYQDRDEIGPLIMVHTARLMNAFGLTEADGTKTRIIYNYDLVGRDDKNNDLYRWDFGITVEFGITTRDQLFTILGANITKIISYEL